MEEGQSQACVHVDLEKATRPSPILYRTRRDFRKRPGRTAKIWLVRLLAHARVTNESASRPAKSSQQRLERLNLEAGEFVQVKSMQEIMETLDDAGRCKGLQFMPEMWKYCGRTFRVFRKVSKLMIEGTGEFRRIAGTVLLENVMCDGSAHYDCDASCFHFWKEAWLTRAPADETSIGAEA